MTTAAPIDWNEARERLASGRLSWAQAMERKAPHLNFRWTMADMDRIQELARKGMTPDGIAFELDSTSVEIVRVCERNHILLRRR